MSGEHPRRRAALLTVALVGVAAVAAVVVVTARNREQPAAAGAAGPADTVQVRRATLVQTEEVAGTLGFGDSRPLVNRLDGTLTEVAAAGTVIAVGQPLYSVDARPVLVLLGALPAYRDLAPGTEGADVEQFERNLSDLGYTGFTADDTYTAVTAAAVRRWQDDLDLPETGVVELGRVVFTAGPVRVATTELVPGELVEPAAPVLTYTGTERVVTAELEVTDRHLVGAATQAVVVLPDRSEVAATVRAIGTVVAGSQDGDEEDDGPATLPLTVVPTDQAALGGLDGAPVTVRLAAASREDVLAVPVAALLALREGGYGVQLVSSDLETDADAGVRVVAVTTGMFAGGLVEVSGGGIAEGDTVGTPGR